eukprot:1518474-Amphidinium_carterae.1
MQGADQPLGEVLKVRALGDRLWVVLLVVAFHVSKDELKRRRTEDEPNRMCPVQPQDGGGRYGAYHYYPETVNY